MMTSDNSEERDTFYQMLNEGKQDLARSGSLDTVTFTCKLPTIPL